MTCLHFLRCGGCVHQDVADVDYRALKRQIVADALARHGVETDVAEIVVVPPGTRRRATMKAKRTESAISLGFHAARTHDIVDIEECLVLTPRLVALLPGLRDMLAGLLRRGENAELKLADTEAGFDLGLRWQKPNDSATLTDLARWADKLNIARISAHGQTVVSLGEPSVRLGRALVALPPETFLQPTPEGEAVLQDFVREHLSRAKTVADLFCGCGTFTFPLAERAKVHAVELEEPMLMALAAAAKNTSGHKPITTEKRNLFKRPLTAMELGRFDAVCIDPPRSGAQDQVKVLAASKIGRIAYISCDAETFARDARILLDGGFRLSQVVPVDQFLWSSHIELAGAFVR